MARIRDIDDPEELRPGNAVGLEWIGRAPTTTPVTRVRDVLLIPTSTAEGDWRTHPPVSSPPVDLGRGLIFGELSHDESELVLNACTPRGHYFFAVRQFAGLYAFVLEVDLTVYRKHHFRWDVEGVIITALQLSRLVRDNGYSPEFAARIVEHEDGEKQVIPQGQHYFAFLPTFRLREDRDWLTVAEAEELKHLVDAYWQNMGALPRQLHRAISLSEGAVHQSVLERQLVMLFMGLEALLNTGKRQVTRQITTRMPLLAKEVGVSGVTKRFCQRMYDDRSSPAHGQELKLQPASRTGQAMRTSQIESAYLAKVARVQELLRAATRKGIEDPSFAATFADAKSIRAKWPVTRRIGLGSFHRKVQL
jgi:hypothetical protein